MKEKIVSKTVLTVLVIGVMALAFDALPVKASGTIYIRLDGSIDPPTAPILRERNTYTFTDNIYDYIVVKRDNIVVDGAGYTVQGTGLQVTGANNVTIGNVEIDFAADGIWLEDSSYTTISGNTITDSSYYGIRLERSSNNYITKNIMIGNRIGISLGWSDDNWINLNTISSGAFDGVTFYDSSHNIIFGNNITLYGICGIDLFGISISNHFYHNNFIDNFRQVEDTGMYSSIWDNGYPSGGNYWSDYKAKYPDAEELDGSGIWDTPYEIDENNQDNYPLMDPWTPPPIPTTMDELETEIEKMGSKGDIDNQGILRSLLAKLNVAQRLANNGKIDEARSILEDDFIPQVQNLAGIHITVEAAAILIESAEYILAHL